MDTALLEVASRYADTHVDASGVARTPVPGLVILRETAVTSLQYAISKPLVALVLQGSKRVSMGTRTFDFGAAESLLITADVPTVSQITSASLDKPYYSIVVELNPRVISTLVDDIGSAPFLAAMPIRVEPTEVEVSDAARRLLCLLDRPAALPILRDQHLRELHYWLLCGQHGGAIRALGVNDSHAGRIARAVEMIRSNFRTSLRTEQLADAAGMSMSAFHVHFRSVTSLSPLQFQKQLRLIEARRTMLADGATIATAAFAVGYESVQQFTREYGRVFGQPPGRDIRMAKTATRSAA
ncbi:AraC family transcriptional regulator [Duganella sp. LjRoot269]|jgi:AraC-like DNA-binding protein|uniref:AraC family transcriptional regulator n=1 Tax=Duganella sp. LjRoot269 TaxID=3342305 RepID=UPI003ED14CDA